jgi:hypothetical protein
MLLLALTADCRPLAAQAPRLQIQLAAPAPDIVWASLYVGSTPASYDTGLWMAAPFTAEGTNIHALVHNEFHGEWTADQRWCTRQEPSIYLPCDHWDVAGRSMRR